MININMYDAQHLCHNNILFSLMFISSKQKQVIMQIFNYKYSNYLRLHQFNISCKMKTLLGAGETFLLSTCLELWITKNICYRHQDFELPKFLCIFIFFRKCFVIINWIEIQKLNKTVLLFRCILKFH